MKCFLELMVLNLQMQTLKMEPLPILESAVLVIRPQILLDVDSSLLRPSWEGQLLANYQPILLIAPPQLVEHSPSPKPLQDHAPQQNIMMEPVLLVLQEMLNVLLVHGQKTWLMQ